MLLIMSAAFIGAELEAEFGKVPPSFLPLGNKRLFQRQLACGLDNEQVVLSIPKSYQIGKADSHFLQSRNVTILRLSEGITLGESLTQALLMVELKGQEKVKVLFGDTLIDSFPSVSNGLGTALIQDDYGWAKVQDFFIEASVYDNDGSLNIFAGSLIFSDKELLLKLLASSNFNFVKGFKEYFKRVEGVTYPSLGWLDFGHVNTFYSSRVKFTTQREFNDLVITPTQVIKTSQQKEKMIGEANWFKTLPGELRIFTPQFLGEISDSARVGYKIEYLYNLPLNELYVFSVLTDKTWKRILESCLSFVKKCRAFENDIYFDLTDFLEKKTISRLKVFLKSNELSLTDSWSFNSEKPISIQGILDEVKNTLPKGDLCSVMHGDFCFSNIIYDFKSTRVKVIDPRGIDNEKNVTILGSSFYDLAKVSHSVVGLYDYIISENYKLTIIDNNIDFYIYTSDEKEALQSWFLNKIESEFHLSKVENLSMQIHLFLSMLPLHSDDPLRQKAIFANVFRIYYKLKELL
tara:strand:- start:4992 stop:6551 length:1560 start_codon:yes stop_codon:yes gene_type:complete